MRFKLIILSGLLASTFATAADNFIESINVSEVVYVESPTDTDGDGNPDRIYVSIERPQSDTKLSSIFYIFRRWTTFFPHYRFAIIANIILGFQFNFIDLILTKII